MTESQQLLADYAKTGSETAFRQLVGRYVNLVYSTALRRVGGDTQLAQDVAQTVFISLARRGRSLPSEVSLGGWLHRHACNTAAKAARAERRRQMREKEAVALNNLHHNREEHYWRNIEPLLDEAITELSREDGAAVVLRFFEQRDFRSIGALLGTSEDAARMRVTRALEKLRVLLKRRGAELSAAALATVLAEEAVTAAPSGLSATVAGAALASVAASHGASAALAKVLIMTKLKAGIIGTVILAVAATSLVVEHQRGAELRQAELQRQNRILRDQIAGLQLEQERFSRRAADPAASRPLNSDRLRELLKLRGEVGRLRQQVREFQQAAAATAKGSRPLAESASTSASAPNRPPPFQLQLVVDEPGENTQTMTNYAIKDVAETLNLQKTPLMDGAAISSATVTMDSASGRPQIEVEFSDVGKELFAAITRENLDKRLAVILDGQIYSTPVIRSEIPDGKAIVTGSFTEDEAGTLAAKINEAIQLK